VILAEVCQRFGIIGTTFHKMQQRRSKAGVIQKMRRARCADADRAVARVDSAARAGACALVDAYAFGLPPRGNSRQPACSWVCAVDDRGPVGRGAALVRWNRRSPCGPVTRVLRANQRLDRVGMFDGLLAKVVATPGMVQVRAWAGVWPPHCRVLGPSFEGVEARPSASELFANAVVKAFSAVLPIA
jgi:hypothetical protein